MKLAEDSQPASAKVGPGRVIGFDHRRCWPWEWVAKDSQWASAGIAERFAVVNERRQRILSTSIRQDCNGSIAQLDFGYGCISNGFTVGIDEADVAITIGGVASEMRSSKNSQPASANVGPPPRGEIGTVNDMAA
jgi:hypothetical protein